MSDLRAALYDRYVSDFKEENSLISEKGLAHYYKWCDERLLPFLNRLAPDAKILELGCGPGKILSYLKARGFTNARGIDISAEQIALASSRGLSAKVADVFEHLEISHDLDCVIAIDLVEHFTKEELHRLFTAAHSALKSRGLFLIQTVNGEGLFPRQIIYGDLTHMTIFTPNSMTQLLRASGFRNIRMAEAAPIASGVKGRARSAAWSIVKFVANMIRKIESGKNQKIWTENFITAAWHE